MSALEDGETDYENSGLARQNFPNMICKTRNDVTGLGTVLSDPYAHFAVESWSGDRADFNNDLPNSGKLIHEHFLHYRGAMAFSMFGNVSGALAAGQFINHYIGLHHDTIRAHKRSGSPYFFAAPEDFFAFASKNDIYLQNCKEMARLTSAQGSVLVDGEQTFEGTKSCYTHPETGQYALTTPGCWDRPMECFPAVVGGSGAVSPISNLGWGYMWPVMLFVTEEEGRYLNSGLSGFIAIQWFPPGNNAMHPASEIQLPHVEPGESAAGDAPDKPLKYDPNGGFALSSVVWSMLGSVHRCNPLLIDQYRTKF